MMNLKDAMDLAERFEREEVIGSTAQALRALLRGYNELLSEYQAYEESVRASDSWEAG
jgi:hypothetical protein